MGYQSMSFLVFSAVVVALYYLVPKKAQRYVLLAANIFFYAYASPKYIPFLLATLVTTFLVAGKISRIYDEQNELLKQCRLPAEKKQVRAQGKKKAKRVLMIALVVSVGLLVVCKYTAFALKNVNAVLGRFGLEKIEMFNMIVPIGISFYTFMAVSYVLDVYWKRYRAEKSFLNYTLFLTYFPHVVQGPIDRYNEFKAQIEKPVAFNSQTVAYGAQLVLWGLFKKLVIADRLGIFVTEVYDGYKTYTGVILVLATVLYSIQIYADFSGCIDIITGVSQALGIEVRKNFIHPYFSKTMPEFWRRWHASLGEWFKDYIYYPVSVSSLVRKVKKNKKHERFGELFASCCPAFVVWVITGIWHGAAWNYVAWGMFHAALIIGGTVFERPLAKINEKLGINTELFSWKLWQMLRTFALCCIGRVFFRANGLRAAITVFTNIFSDFGAQYFAEGALYDYGLNRNEFFFALVSIAVLWVVDMLQERMQIRKELQNQGIVFRWVIIFLGIFSVMIFGIYGPKYDAAAFIYEQF